LVSGKHRRSFASLGTLALKWAPRFSARCGGGIPDAPFQLHSDLPGRGSLTFLVGCGSTRSPNPIPGIIVWHNIPPAAKVRTRIQLNPVQLEWPDTIGRAIPDKRNRDFQPRRFAAQRGAAVRTRRSRGQPRVWPLRLSMERPFFSNLKLSADSLVWWDDRKSQIVGATVQ